MSDAEVNLSDNYVILLENTLKESKNLRQQVEKSDESTSKALKELTERVDKLCETMTKQSTSSHDSASRSAKRRVIVPRLCRVCKTHFILRSI